MGKNINTAKNEAHASFSPDGQILLLASDRRGGFGGLDIYHVRKVRMANGENRKISDQRLIPLRMKPLHFW